MNDADKQKVINHALDHVAYNWAPCLPVRHDGRFWTEEEKALYKKTYDEAYNKTIKFIDTH